MRTLARLSRAFTLTCLAAAFYAWLVEPYWLEVTRHSAVLPGHTLRIVHLSDLHTRGLGRREERMVQLVERERPDLIVMTGDFLTGRGGTPATRADIAGVKAVVSRLRARLGVYAVPGNWEYWRGLGRPHVLVEGTGARMLRNSAVEVRPRLWLVGLDDECAGDPDDDLAFRGVPRGAAAIAILHSPAPFRRLAPRAPLVFAGHSHGGQMRLPFLPPLWLPPGTEGFVAGWYSSGNSRLYVSRGVGTSVLPLRLWCRPEIAVVDVRPR